MDKAKWEEKKAMNGALERRAKQVRVLNAEANKPGSIVRMSDGRQYKIMPDMSWRLVKK